jgi:hypothetical protein
VARLEPQAAEAMVGIPDMRRWQVEALGEHILNALKSL